LKTFNASFEKLKEERKYSKEEEEEEEEEIFGI